MHDKLYMVIHGDARPVWGRPKGMMKMGRIKRETLAASTEATGMVTNRSKVFRVYSSMQTLKLM